VADTRGRRLRWTFSGDEGAPAYGADAAGQKTPRTLTGEDIRIVYQPIIDLKNGSLFAQEALVRCAVPDLASPPVLFERAAAEKSCGRLGRLIREAVFKGCPGVPLFVSIRTSSASAGWSDPMIPSHSTTRWCFSRSPRRPRSSTSIWCRAC
jgi:hypothetical protein